MTPDDGVELLNQLVATAKSKGCDDINVVWSLLAAAASHAARTGLPKDKVLSFAERMIDRANAAIAEKHPKAQA